MDTCMFCKAIKGEAPSSIRYEDEVRLAFMIRLFVWWALEGALTLHPAYHLSGSRFT